MIYLIISIVCLSVIYQIFRAFGKLQVDPTVAIAYNYLFAASTGWIYRLGSRDNHALPEGGPLWFILILGLLFFIVFNLMQRTTQLLGVSGSTIVGRMSLLIPVGVSVILYNEELGLVRIGGIILALASIFLTVYQRENPAKKKSWKNMILMIALTFIGVGGIDALMKVSQEQVLDKVDALTFVALLYSAAFISGMCYLIFNKEKRKLILSKRNFLSGLILGIINFFSIYLFILALKSSGLDGSILFPVNSVGIVIISTILALIIFKEKLTILKISGLVLAVIALIMINSQ